PNFRVRPVRFPTKWKLNHPTLWWKWYLPHVLRRDALDVFHGPNHFLPQFDRRKCIVTIHDLAYFRMEVHGRGMDEAMRQWTRHALDQAEVVIALSENTRRDVEALGVKGHQIRVIYGGGHVVPEDKIAYDRAEVLKRARNLPEQYILFVGTL